MMYPFIFSLAALCSKVPQVQSDTSEKGCLGRLPAFNHTLGGINTLWEGLVYQHIVYCQYLLIAFFFNTFFSLSITSITVGVPMCGYLHVRACVL